MDNKILILDIETTGFLNEGGSIVEVGIVSLDLSSGSTQILFDSVCRENILTGRHREEPMGWIFRNSTLTVEAVRNAPLLQSLLTEVQSIINRYPIGATAYNRDFDFNFLESRGICFETKLPCPMQLSTAICKIPARHFAHGNYKWPKVEEAWKHFFPDVDYIELHRGADDAVHEAKIVYELYKSGVFTLG